MPVQEVDIGAPAVAQCQDEPRRALVQIAERPEGLDALDVAGREAVQVRVENMQHVAELIDSLDPRDLQFRVTPSPWRHSTAKLAAMKPHVTCHMVTSIDGRIWGSRWRPKANVIPNLFEKLHDQLVASTAAARGCAAASPPRNSPAARIRRNIRRATRSSPRENWFARRDAKAWGIFLDAHGKAVWERSDIGGDPILVILTEAVSDRHLAGLRGDSVSYIFAGKTKIDLAAALETLNRELGIERLLLEGGGGANGALLRAGWSTKSASSSLPRSMAARARPPSSTPATSISVPRRSSA